MVKLSVIFCSLVIACLSPLLGQISTKARVGFRVVSPSGGVATDATIELTNRATGERIKATLGRLSDREAQRKVPAAGLLIVENVPFGRYAVTAKAFLLAQGKEQIEIEVARSEQWFTICLPLDVPLKKWQPTQEPVSGESVLRGRILATKRTGQVWIKIVGVYNRIAVETVADATGVFTADGLRSGKYVAIMTGAGGSVDVVPFEFRGDGETVEFKMQ